MLHPLANFYNSTPGNFVFPYARGLSFYLTLIGAALGPVLFLFSVLLDDDELDGKSKDPLNALFKILSEMNGVALFPLFIILICTLLPQVEYRNNTQTKANVFTETQRHKGARRASVCHRKIFLASWF